MFYDCCKARKQWLEAGGGVLAPKSELHQKKVRLVDVQWSDVWELLPHGQAITDDHYYQQLDYAQQRLVEMGVETRRIFFHHHYVRPHTAHQTLAKIEELGWTKVNQPPYSPDIAPSDYRLFLSMDHFSNARRFSEVDEVRETLDVFFNRNPLKKQEKGHRQ